MFENLTEKLQRTFKNLRGQGKLTEEHLDVALGEIREALIEGDVNVGVADELLVNIRSKALGSKSCCSFRPTSKSSRLCATSSPIFSANTPSRCLPRGRLPYG
jgi:Signal recognition particle GTPase